MRIAVFGPGGAAGYFGGRLAQAGEDVVFVARGAHLAAIRASGLKVESIQGDFHIHPATATDRPEEIGPVDWLICGVKAWQVPGAAEAMRPMVGPHTAVLPLQNGVEAAGQIAAAVGKEHAVGGVCYISSMLSAPGVIRHSAIEPRVIFGELDGSRSPRVQAMWQALNRAGVQVEITENVQVAIWSKFLFISAISGVGAVARLPVGDYRALPETRTLLAAAMEETAAVARARGVGLPEGLVQQTMAFIDGLPSGATASMQRDIVEGRPSELESQNEAVVRLGRETGVATPTHDFIYAALLPQERKARTGVS